MNKLNIPKNIPMKWLLAIFATAIVYGLLQPTLNKRFGLQLPSVGELANQRPVNKTTSSDNSSGNAHEQFAPNNGKSSSVRHSSQDDIEATHTRSADGSQSESNPAAGTAKATNSSVSSDPLDYLETIGNQTYRSPKGLIYKRGSAEGHRLKHLERHLKNDANRPGSHGVFEGDMVHFLMKIDDAYQRAQRKDKGTKMYDEEDRTIYEASFGENIGYLGGQEGKRRQNPKLKRIRLVVDGESVITAFPF